MDSNKEYCQEATGGDEETENAAGSSKSGNESSMSNFGLLKLYSTKNLKITFNNKEQYDSNGNYDISITNNSAKTKTGDLCKGSPKMYQFHENSFLNSNEFDIGQFDNSKNGTDIKTGDLCQGSPKRYKFHEKFLSSSNEFDIDNSPNLSPINIYQESMLSDIMIAADEKWSPYESDQDSGLDEPEDVPLDLPLNLVNCNPLTVDKNDTFDDDYNEKFYKSDISDISQDLNIDSLRLFNKSFSGPDQEPQNLTNKSVIQKFSNTWDLTKLSGENKTNEGNREITGTTYLPDDEFLEADRYLGDKGKQPASKRYAYKKRSKSTANQAGVDSDNIANNLTACDIKSNQKPSASNIEPSTLPVGTFELLGDRNNPSPTSYENPPASPTESTLFQRGLRDSGIRWSFQDCAFKLFSSDARVLNFSTGRSNNNNCFSYKNENYCDSPSSDDDVNFQKGLLMSLQDMNYDDDSDLDVTA